MPPLRGCSLNTEAASINYGVLAHHLAMRDGSYPVEKMQGNIGGSGGGEIPISHAGHRDQLANRIVGETHLRRFLIFLEKPILGQHPPIKPQQLRKPNDFCVPVSCKTSPQ